MPWWFWVLLWGVLALCAAGVLGLLALRAGRRLFAAAHAVSDWSEQMARRWEEGSTAVARRIRNAPVPGILVPVDQARQTYLRDRDSRRDRLAARRIARRSLRGQPQRLGDLRRGAQKGHDLG